MLQIADNPALRAAIIYIALLVIGVVPLAVRIIAIRRGERIGMGDGGNRPLARAIRVHANYVEYTTFGLALLLALPLSNNPAWCVHFVGLCLIIGRIAHAIGLTGSSGSSLGRVGGMILTFTALLGGAAILLWRAWG